MLKSCSLPCLLIKQRFKGNCCKSDMPLNKWRFIQNIVYSPFKFYWELNFFRYLVPRNMTVERRLEFRLLTINTFLAFIYQNYIRSKTLKFKNTKHVQNMVCHFCAFKITWGLKSFVQNSTFQILLNKLKSKQDS